MSALNQDSLMVQKTKATQIPVKAEERERLSKTGKQIVHDNNSEEYPLTYLNNNSIMSHHNRQVNGQENTKSLVNY
jgi:hypothetical protein